MRTLSPWYSNQTEVILIHKDHPQLIGLMRTYSTELRNPLWSIHLRQKMVGHKGFVFACSCILKFQEICLYSHVCSSLVAIWELGEQYVMRMDFKSRSILMTWPPVASLYPLWYGVLLAHTKKKSSVVCCFCTQNRGAFEVVLVCRRRPAPSHDAVPLRWNVSKRGLGCRRPLWRLSHTERHFFVVVALFLTPSLGFHRNWVQDAWEPSPRWLEINTVSLVSAWHSTQLFCRGDRSSCFSSRLFQWVSSFNTNWLT